MTSSVPVSANDWEFGFALFGEWRRVSLIVLCNAQRYAASGLGRLDVIVGKIGVQPTAKNVIVTL